MKTIKLFATLAALCWLGSVCAQPPGPPGGMMDPEQRIQQMITQLEITKEQEPAFREVMAKVNEKRTAVMQEMMANGPGGDRSVMMSKMQAIQAETEEMLTKVLTEGQMTKYKEQMASRRQGPPR